MKKSIKFIVPAALAAIALVACTPTEGGEGGGGTSGSVTLTIWDDSSNLATLREIGNQFNADLKRNYPNAPAVNFNFVSEGEAAAVSDMLTLAETGQGPDIASITSDTLATAVRNNLIAPIEYDEEIKSCFGDEIVANVTLNNQVYAYPITAESQTIMYDKRQVSDPSIFDDFDKLLASGKRLVWDVNGDDSAYYMFAFLNDANLFGENGQDENSLNLTTTQSVQNVYDFLTKYDTVIEPESPEVGPALIESEEVVGVVSSPFLYATMVDTLGEENVGLHTLPKINGNDLRPFSGYKEYVVSSYSRNPAIANMFANYLVNSESQLARMMNLNYLPTRYDGDIEEMLELSDTMPTYQASYELSKPMPTIEKMAGYWSPMITACQTLWSNRDVTSGEDAMTLAYVEDALEAVEEAINK